MGFAEDAVLASPSSVGCSREEPSAALPPSAHSLRAPVAVAPLRAWCGQVRAQVLAWVEPALDQWVRQSLPVFDALAFPGEAYNMYTKQVQHRKIKVLPDQ